MDDQWGELSAGPHKVTIVATDNAGNIAHEDFLIFVHHASPMGLGPGSFDPQSGNYSLGASDVSMGSGLTVSRSYSSRNLTAGVEGVLGPQWATSLAGSESLEEAADGNMVLTAANGGETAFELNSKGEFESPNGDANVTLTAKKNEAGVPVAYTLKDTAAGTTSTFERAKGYLQTAPDYYGEIGWQGPGIGQLNTAMGVASDAKGDAWVADTKNNCIEQFDPGGEYISQFGFEGAGRGEFKEPRGIAVDPKGDLWVADTGNNRVQEFNVKGEWLRTIGVEGLGTLKSPQGITADSNGNIWVTDTGDNRVVEFGETGGYIREAAKTVGTLWLSEPVGVATDSIGDVWVTDAKNHRFVEFSPAGAALKEFGKQGVENGQFETPSGIAVDIENDVYVADYGANRIQEFNAKGEYLTKFGTTGSDGAQFKRPYMMAIDQRGMLLVADSENSRVSRWAHAAWLPSLSEGSVATSQVSYSYKAVRTANGTLVEPTEVLAPHASELSCSPTINKGCRALVLRYAEKTSAGENESEWNEYEGRLKEVLFAAYNPATGRMEEKAVAQYAYDAKGRLRAEWDPRISPALKTLYGYDAEGHVTAVSAPGQEPWLIHYGTIPTDSTAGRVLSVVRPAASTENWSHLAPSNSTRPTLSSTEAKVGVKLSVSSNGSWSNTVLAYSYQWERCNGVGAECAAIAGAVNESYYPTASDEGHELVAEVSAANAGGSTGATTTATGLVGSGTPNSQAPEPPNVGTNSVTTVEYAVPVSGTGLPTLTEAEVKKWGQQDDPVEGTAVFPPDKPMGWPAKEYETASFTYFDAEGRTVDTVNASGGITTAEYDETNNIVRSLSARDRAIAMKESCESDEKCKSAEVASKLDTERVYNEEGDELLQTLGPEHTIRLPKGQQVPARKLVRYAYDQNAPKGGTYRLLTETREAALVASTELVQRITQTHYYGQKGLGWVLRKPTSVTVDPYGLKLTTTTVYDPKTGAVTETGTPTGLQEKDPVDQATYVKTFGSGGFGQGQFYGPWGIASNSAGDVYVADGYNQRVQEFTAEGSYIRQWGSEGTGDSQFKGPEGIAVDSKGNVWVADKGNDRVEEFTGEGVFIRAFGAEGSGNGQLKWPQGIAVDSTGNVWVADYGNSRIEEFTETGGFERTVGSYGSGNDQLNDPGGVAVDAKGDVVVADTWNHRIEEFTATGEYIRQFGTRGTGTGEFKHPWRVSIGPEGYVWVSDSGNNRMQVLTLSGEYLYEFGTAGSGEGQFSEPAGASFYKGNAYVLDRVNERVEIWRAPAPVYQRSFASGGFGPGEFYGPWDIASNTAGDVYVADEYNDRVQEFTAEGSYVREWGSEGTGNGQFKAPAGVAVDAKGNVWVSDETNNRIEEFTGQGAFIRAFGSEGSGNGQLKRPSGLTVDSAGNVWVADYANSRIEEFTETGGFERTIGSYGSGQGQLNDPGDVAIDTKGDLVVADTWNHRIVQFTTAGQYVHEFGERGSGNGQFIQPWRVSVGPEGDIWVSDSENYRMQVFSETGEYLTQFGSYGSAPGQMKGPSGVSFHAGEAYVLDRVGERVEVWQTEGEVAGTATAHDKQTIYYTAAANTQYPACGGHAEWEGMLCVTVPGAQPTGSSAPSLPTTSVGSYNMWGEPETTTETFPAAGSFGEATRTTKVVYNEAGKPIESEQTSSSPSDRALPKVVTSESFGKVCGYARTVRCVTQTMVEGEATETITSIYDTLDRLIGYTDADKNTTTYEYEASGDGRLVAVTDSKGWQDYAYDPKTGAMTKLLDATAKTFTASYDVEGSMESETYPNGMTATYTRDATGGMTGIEYVKTSHCTEKCVWFSETSVPTISGETGSRVSTLTSDSHAYDQAGRLIQATETPAGKGCTTRIYGYDEDTNRTSLVTRQPGSEGQCATEGGTVETHAYDAADRLNDTGVLYDPLGNTTKLPAGDAGGYELTTSYYVDGQVEKQTQNGQTNTYSIDPAGRIRRTIGEKEENEKTIITTTISHYGASGEAVTWKDEGSGKYTRLIPSIDGTLSATETNEQAPVLQLHDLQGDIIATAGLSETETKLLSTYESTTFGVPQPGTTEPTYSWLGASGASSELSSGTLIQGTVAYQPQLARRLQTQPVIPPGLALNGATETAPYEAQVSGWEINANNATGAQDTHEYELEKQEAAQREAQEKTCAVASMCVTPEEEYYYAQAQALAEEAAEESASRTTASIASAKVHINVGCLEAGFWTFCSGQYHGKWFNTKVTTNRKSSGKWFNTGDKVLSGGIGVGLFIKGAATGVACLTAAAATPEDGLWPLVPLEFHCAGSAFVSMALGAGGVIAAVFG